MENLENTYQIPETENTPLQEENSSPVQETESEINEISFPESVQTQKLPIEEFPETHLEKKEGLTDNSNTEEANPDNQIPDILSVIKEEHADEEPPEEMAEHETNEPEEVINTLSKEQLVNELEKAINEPDLNLVKTRIALIKVAFLKKKKEENLQQYEKFAAEESHKEISPTMEDPLETRFNEFFNIYKANKARFNEEQEKIKLLNLNKKNQILEELRLLVNSEETLKKTYDEFKTLQDRWKEIGMVPRNEINNLWQNYHFLVEKFFDKVKLNKELNLSSQFNHRCKFITEIISSANKH